ncbi:MAG TPA: TonB family protein [Nitrospirota bacterium]
MFPRLPFTKFLTVSFALHAMMIAAALYLIKPAAMEKPFVLPVEIVNLPPQETKQLPPLQQRAPVPPAPVAPPPVAPRRFMPEKPLPPGQVPMPKKFGESEDIKLPKTTPRTGMPEGAEQGKETGKTTPQLHKGAGPLPFLTQQDIDELARKGMPEKKPGDDSVTLDTDEFKFISYNRWLKIKVESVLKYPELAAVSGYQGTLYIKFDIMKDGSLGGVELLKSSGYKILDDEALRSIRDSAPFQPLPSEWNMDRYSIRAAVIFYLGEGYIR